MWLGRRQRDWFRQAPTIPALAQAIGALPEFPITLDAACTATVPIVVPVDAPGTRGRQRLRAKLRRHGGSTQARLDLHCVAP